jgi:hypothetical protein
MGERAFSKLQYGKEVKTTHGTAVAATKMLMAETQPLRPDRKPVYVPANLGVRSDSVKSHIYQVMAKDTLNLKYGYFQALPLLFSCGLKGDVTAAETTPAQADYAWDFSPSETGDNTPDSLTLEVGDDVQAYEMEYLMFERIRISGTVAQDAGEAPVAIAADYFARQISTATFTGALSIPAVEMINAKKALLYLDTTWAGVGGTALPNILRAFDLEILTGVHPVFSGDANLYYATHGQSVIGVTLALTLEGNATADAIWDAMNSQALQVVRLSISGAQIGTGVSHKLQVDVSGTWEEVVPMGENDRGNNLHTAVLHGKYDTTGGKKLAVSVVTNQNVL